jgi:hypothetical protein
MNDDRFKTNDPAKRLDDLRRRPGDQDEALSLDENEVELAPAEEGRKSYSLVSADRMRKLMLVLWKINGNAKAMAYSYLVAVDWLRSDGIKMDFSSYSVEILGRNLQPVFDGLVAQRIASIRELDDVQARANLPEKAPVVTKITIVEIE